MHEQHPVFRAPDDPEATIWRYTSLSKLIALLSSRCLFFCRVDQLGDPFEGSVTTANLQWRKKAFADVLKTGSNPLEMIGNVFRGARRFTAVNCWHVNEQESAAMWNLYARDGEGIAVKSTYGRLCRSFHGCDDRIYIGFVNYIDYDDPATLIPEGNLFYPIMHKRKSFEHEHELRAAVTRWPPSGVDWTGSTADTIDGGLLEPMDLEVLIEELRVSPAAPRWYADAVMAASVALGLKCPIRQSALDTPPCW